MALGHKPCNLVSFHVRHSQNIPTIKATLFVTVVLDKLEVIIYSHTQHTTLFKTQHFTEILDRVPLSNSIYVMGNSYKTKWFTYITGSQTFLLCTTK